MRLRQGGTDGTRQDEFEIVIALDLQRRNGVTCCVSRKMLGHAGENRGDSPGNWQAMTERVFKQFRRNGDSRHDEHAGRASQRACHGSRYLSYPRDLSSC